MHIFPFQNILHLFLDLRRKKNYFFSKVADSWFPPHPPFTDMSATNSFFFYKIDSCRCMFFYKIGLVGIHIFFLSSSRKVRFPCTFQIPDLREKKVSIWQPALFHVLNTVGPRVTNCSPRVWSSVSRIWRTLRVVNYRELF